MYGSKSCIDLLYGGDNPHSATLFQNRITKVRESCSVSDSNINYDEGRISNLSGRTRFSLNTRVGGQNLYCPGPSAGNLYDNVGVGGQHLYGPGSHIEYHRDGGDIRSVDVCVEPVSVLPNELNLWNDNVKVGGQPLYGPAPHIEYYMAGRDIDL